MPLGTFNVAGKDFDTAAVAAVKEVKEAAQANNVIKLWSALQSTYFEGALEENIEAYETAVNKAATDNKLNTVADVNKLIDDVNKAQVSDEAEAAVVKSVVDGIGGNPLQVYNLLNKNFDRVNSNWVATYLAEEVNLADDSDVALGSLDNENYFNEDAGASIEGIQAAIDSANAKEVAKAYDDAFKSLKASDVADARALANKYLTANADDAVTQKEYANDSLDILNALIRVNEAKTPNALKSALTALDNLETSLVNKYNASDIDIILEKDIDLTKVNDDLLGEYITKIANTDVNLKNQRSDIQTLIEGVNSQNASTKLANVKSADTADKLLAALKAYPELKNVADSNKNVYYTGSNDKFKNVTADNIQAAVNQANVTAVQAAATETADKLLAALKVVGVANVNDANKSAYFTGASFYDADTETTVKAFTLANDKDKVQAVVNATNAFVNANKATTATELRTSLTTFAVELSKLEVNKAPDFINLSSQKKLEVAQIVLDGKETNFANAGELAEAANDARKAHEAFLDGTDTVDGVNDATDIAEMKAALSNETVFPEFVALDEATKVEKAEAVLNALVAIKEDGNTGFTTIKQIKDIVEK